MSSIEGSGRTRGAEAESLLGDGGKHAGIVQALMDSQGGLGGLLRHLNQGGLPGVVGSWIGTGTNQPVTGEQVHAALPPEVVNQIAGKLGIEPNAGLERPGAGAAGSGRQALTLGLASAGVQPPRRARRPARLDHGQEGLSVRSLSPGILRR